MIIDFEESTHQYFMDGDLAGVSVTELLANQGIAPNYKGVNKEVLNASAERGTAIHEDLANFLNTKKYKVTTPEGKQFRKWARAKLDSGVGEQVLGMEYKGLIICGTADMLGILKESNEFIIVDHKTTSTLHREYVQWQVNIYDYILRHISGQEINGHVINWKGADKLYCFLFLKDGHFRKYELDRIDDSEIERLLDCEIMGESYKQPLLVIDKELREKWEQAEITLEQIKEQHEIAEKNAVAMRNQIKSLFEAQGIKSWESYDKRVKVSYVNGYTTNRVDSKKLKEDFPRVYASVIKEVETKPHIQITVRKEKKNETE